MVKCPECNAENPDGTKFCSECGTKLVQTAAQNNTQEPAPVNEQPAEQPQVQEQPQEQPQVQEQPEEKEVDSNATTVLTPDQYPPFQQAQAQQPQPQVQQPQPQVQQPQPQVQQPQPQVQQPQQQYQQPPVQQQRPQQQYQQPQYNQQQYQQAQAPMYQQRPQQQYQQPPVQQQRSQPQMQQRPQPQVRPAAAPVADTGVKALGTGAYFGLLLLFAIPIINFIAALIISIAAKNKNLKHFALGKLIWLIIELVLTIGIIVACYLLGQAIAEYIEGITGSFSSMF